jgi:hypothetical protein
MPGDRMAVANMDLLKRAIGREAPAIITAGEGTARRQLMIQFDRDQTSPEGIWAHFQEQDAGLVQRLSDARNSVEVWFQSGRLMVQFSAKLLKKRHGLSGHLLLIEPPSAISIVEERHQPRWMVPANFSLAAKIQVLAPHRAVEWESPARVWDIGMEGASLICPTNKRVINMVKDAWLKVNLHIRGCEHGYAAVFRHMSQASDQSMRLGVQFMPSGDPSAAQAHEALVSLVSELEKLSAGKDLAKLATHAA